MVLLKIGGEIMIKYKKGNLLEDDAEALVNTVNCVGVMGKGIALQFKQAFPENFIEYKKACHKEKVQLGKMFIHDTGNLFNHKYIINFPTKKHWRSKAYLKDIELGLQELVTQIKRLGIKSIAIPPLGCGNGGLDWKVVKPKIEAAFSQLPNIQVHLYIPAGSPDNDTMLVNTKRPKLTKARALFITLMGKYSVPGYRLSLLEIQKLAYFLQETGEPLRLNFVKGKYGPYAENLNFVLQNLEGHYIRGYGDRSNNAQIKLLPTSYQEAAMFLETESESTQRLNTVENIIFGYETPYGLELLSTVHWVAKEKDGINTELQTIILSIQEWNERKRKLFRYEHVQKAWENLKSFEVLFSKKTV